MSNFGRVLRISMRYRLTFVASLGCALLAAVLWGGNIAAIYPILQVALQGQSLQERMENDIRDSDRKVAECQATVQQREAKLAAAPPKVQRSLEIDIRKAEARIKAEQAAADRNRFLLPYVVKYMPESPFTTVALIVAAIVLGTLLKNVFLVGNSILISRLAELTTFALRKRFYRRTVRMDLATFSNEGTSDLMSRFTNDMNNLSSGLMALFGRMILEPLKATACLIGAAIVCWRLLLLSLLLAPPAMILIRAVAKALKRANRRAMEEMAQIYGTLDETFRGIKIVKAFTMERQERRRFHVNGKKYFRKAVRIMAVDALAHPITEIMGVLTICLAILAGAWLTLQGETHLLGIRMCERPLDLPTLMIFFGLLVGVADPARKLTEVLSRIQQASAASDRIYALLDREPTVTDSPRARTGVRHQRDLVFEGVGFGYRPGQPVLQGVDLRIAFGETVAIVGPNGCGKSTLANLIPRFADPTSGTIRLDGIPLPELRLRCLRGQIGLVTQETLLFDDTVFHNIRYGSPRATRQEVIAAAEQAHAHRFIEDELPESYETVVGQSGGRLSGGQRQRIALARAILRDPSIIILDEATSQIDLESEQLIQNTLEQFIRNRTAIIITHRLGILALADRVVVMDGGRIVDVGSHAELLERCDVYTRLHQLHACRPAA